MARATLSGTSALDSAHDSAASTDEMLMARFRAGRDEAAFTALVHRYEHELFAYLRRRLGRRETAEEAFQETFLSVYCHADQFDATRPFRPWLFAIAANRACDVLRREARDRTVHFVAASDGSSTATGTTLVETLAAAGGPSADALAEAGESGRLVRAALLRLSEPQRRVVALIFGEGRKYREAAASLGIPIGTVKSRLHAALRRVARMLDPLGPPRDLASALPVR